MRVAFLIRSLGVGGAERQLVCLARGLAARGHSVFILTFYEQGPFARELADTNVHVRPVGKSGRWDILGFSGRLARCLRDIRPDVLHGYMPVECAVGLLAARRARVPFVWGIRAAALPVQLYDRLVRFSYRLQPHLVSYADLVISNSQAGLASLGVALPARQAVVIPNGIDIERFRPDLEQRARGRELIGVDAAVRVVATVGRLDPVKAHDVFLRGAARCLQHPGRSLRFVIAGGGSAQQFENLQRLARELRIEEHVSWLPESPRPELIYNAADLVVSTSLAEGFSNALAEALACGAPVVATRVGDAARLVTSEDTLVPPGDEAALAAAMVDMLEREDVDRTARHRSIAERYSIAQLVERTERALQDVLRARGLDA